MAKRRKIRRIQIALGNFDLAGSALVSGTAPRATIEEFKPKPTGQPRLFTGDLLPPVEIPKPPPKKRKPAPKEQMQLFGADQK